MSSKVRFHREIMLAACLALGAATLLPQRATATALPENDMHLDDNMLAADGIAESEFDDILDRLDFIFRPVFYFHGAELVIERFWSDATVNAYATRNGNKWIIQMFGGLARRKEVTPDGFAIVACHELGHHLGGYPFKGDRWAASEGQSDYYATQVCARALWRYDSVVNATFRTTAPQVVRDRCDAQWASIDERDLCYRIGVASKSTSDLFAALEGSTTNYNTTDPGSVSTTVVSHPGAQCRLDTYLAGSRCTVLPTLDSIPGLNNPLGRNSALAEVEAATFSCAPASAWLSVANYNGQDRPRCWFRNQLAGTSP